MRNNLLKINFNYNNNNIKIIIKIINLNNKELVHK